MLDRLRPGITAANKNSDRFQRIKQTLLKSPVHLCLERAELVTAFFRSYNNPSDPVIIQKACMINQGVHGYLKSFETRTASLHLAARIAAKGLVDFADRLAVEAERQAAVQPDNRRADELLSIARICHKVPREPAETFQEALQSLWITSISRI